MQKRTVSRIMLVLLFLSLFVPSMNSGSLKGAVSRSIIITDFTTGSSNMTLGNETQELPPRGIPFTLNVSLRGHTSNLATWEVAITFDNNTLNCTNVWIPSSDPSYVFHGKSEISAVDLSHVNYQPPEVVAGSSLLNPNDAVTVDNALLCMVNFTAFKVGEKSETSISFMKEHITQETFLLDSNGVDIPFLNQTFSVNILEGTIVPDVFPTIQEAINSVNGGDSILVRKGTYYENVVANKTVALLGEDRDATIIDGSGSGYVVGIKGADNVSLCNFTIRDGQTGVYAGDWGAGIQSSRGVILHNLVEDNSESGIFIGQGDYWISGNQVTSNGIGISIHGEGAVNGTFRNNEMENNSRYNFAFSSTVYDQLDMDPSNMVDGKPVYYWIGHLDETIPSNAGQVTLVDCSNTIVQSLELMKNSVNVQLVNCVDCTLENTKSSLAYVGVSLINSRDCNVKNNALSSCNTTIQVLGSTYNNITDNYVQASGFCGIDFDDSSNNSFYHNTVNDSGATYVVYRAGRNIWDNGYPSGGNYWSDYIGVDLESGPNQDLPGSDSIGDTPYVMDANNTDHYPLVLRHSLSPVHNVNTGLDYATIQAAIDAPETLNGHGILVDAGTYYEHVVVNKSVSLVGENSRTTIIDGSSTGAVVNITANNVNLTGFTIRNSGSTYQSCGILVPSSYSTISHNNVADNNGDGIYLLPSSSSNNIYGNTVLNNTGTGIFLSSNNNNLDENNIVGNHHYGVLLHSCSNNNLSGNNITSNYEGVVLWFSSSNNSLNANNIVSNPYHGVWLDYSSNNSLTGNCITDNDYGVWLQDYSSDNSLVGNNITNNHSYGLGLDSSSNNKIYHNNFVNSANTVGTLGLVNFWDNGYPSGGNYWSDYNGSDVFRGAYQNETGCDGIIDAVRVIDANNDDRFPLTKPYGGPHDIGVVMIDTSEHTVGHIHVWINVEIINYGEQIETFNMSIWANSTRIETQTITLISRNSTTVTFVWNTTRVAIGNYSIAALADTLPGEVDTTDNNCSSGGLVFVTVSGDVTGVGGRPDGVVDRQDIYALVGKFNTRPASQQWNPDMDINDDGVCNVRDIAIAIFNCSKF